MYMFTLVQCMTQFTQTHSEVDSDHEADLTTSFDVVHETEFWDCSVVWNGMETQFNVIIRCVLCTGGEGR